MNDRLSHASVLLVLTLLASSVGNAWHGGGRHYHAPDQNYDGGEQYSRGGGWGSPGVVIGVPLGGYYAPGYYPAPVCETVRVCNQYNRCWLEDRCD